MQSLHYMALRNSELAEAYSLLQTHSQRHNFNTPISTTFRCPGASGDCTMISTYFERYKYSVVLKPRTFAKGLINLQFT